MEKIDLAKDTTLIRRENNDRVVAPVIMRSIFCVKAAAGQQVCTRQATNSTNSCFRVCCHHSITAALLLIHQPY